VLGFLPLVAVAVIFINVARGGLVTDFENTFYVAAQAIADGESPYPPNPDAAVVALGKAYVYPPLTALVSLPSTPVSSQAAGLVVMALMCLAVVATLALLGIRDWRCYGLAFLWQPVISAIQTGNITILLALGAALAWRYRDDAVKGGGALGVTLGAKIILWPLAVWFVLTRRRAAAAYAVAVGLSLVLVSWAVIGFAGLADYPELLRRLQELERSQGYTVYALAFDLGASEALAAMLWTALAVALVAAVVVLSRRGDDRRAFVVALAAALACSPIVWLHYFALLLVVVAVAEPRLGPAWFVPLAMYGSTGTFNGTTLQTALTVTAAALTVALALRFPTTARDSVRLPAPVGLREST
jgi:Glycosyltransferase family 87